MAADGGLRVEDLKKGEDVIREVIRIRGVCQEHGAKLEKLALLDSIAADLATLQKAQAALHASAVASPEVLGSEAECVREYVIREDDFSDGNRARSYTAGAKEMKEEAGNVRLFGQVLTRESSDGTLVDIAELPGYLDDPEPKSELQKAIQRAYSERNVVRIVKASKVRSGGVVRTPFYDDKLARLIKAAPAEVQRAFADSTTVGGEWIPDDYVPALQTYIKGARAMGMGGLIEDVIVGRDTTHIPYLSGGFIPYVRGKTTSDDPAQFRASSMGTDERIITVKTLAVRTQVDDEAAEDAYAFFLPQIFQEAAWAIVTAEESAMLNGDTTATHEDAIASWTEDGAWPASPGGGSDDHRRMIKGLRRRAVDISNTVDRSTFTFSTWQADKATIKGPKNGPQDIVALVNGKILATKLMTLAEVVTIEKFGPNATVVGGELARLGGVPLLESELMTGDLASTGLYTGSGSTGGYVMMKRSRFKRIVRRALRFAVQRDETRGIAHHVWSERGLPLYNIGASGELNVRYAYNMS